MLALVIRLGLSWYASPEQLGSDTPFFRDGAAEMARSGRFTANEPGSGGLVRTAKHPPGFVMVLAVAERVGFDSVRDQRVLLAVIGTAGVALAGLAGFRLRGIVAGTATALVAAIHPMWLQPGVIIMSESIYLTVVAGAVLMSLVHLDAPSPMTAALSAAVVSAAALVRSEALLALILLAPILLLVRGTSGRQRLRLVVGFGAGTLLVLGPWLGRNIMVAGAPVMSTNAGVTLVGANCDPTYSGDNQGGFNLRCALGSAAVARAEATLEPGPELEVELDSNMRGQAIDYARAHPQQAIETAAVRVLRTWTSVKLDAQVHLDEAEGRLPRWQTVGRWIHGVLLVPAVIGAVVLFRASRRRAAVVAVFVAQVTITAAVVFGSARMRAAAEPAIAIFAGIGIATVVGWLRRASANGVLDPTELAPTSE